MGIAGIVRGCCLASGQDLTVWPGTDAAGRNREMGACGCHKTVFSTQNAILAGGN
jgi:hypothetical protein